jgi:hypothetical protein
MSQGQRIRSYDYVNHPYARVRDALRANPTAVFQSATKAAAARANSLASELRVDVGGLKVSADIAISVKQIAESPGTATSGPSTVIQLEWEAVNRPHLFPFMQAELTLYPLTATETQLDFAGAYRPPLGVLGSAVNAVVGHRIAEGSVHRFVTDVAEYLRTSLKQG